MINTVSGRSGDPLSFIRSDSQDSISCPATIFFGEGGTKTCRKSNLCKCDIKTKVSVMSKLGYCPKCGSELILGIDGPESRVCIMERNIPIIDSGCSIQNPTEANSYWPFTREMFTELNFAEFLFNEEVLETA